MKEKIIAEVQMGR